MTVTQAAEFLGVHPRTVYEYHYQGRLAVKRLGRQIRIEPAALEEMLR